MNIFSFLRFFRGDTDEPVKEERQSRAPQERPRGFFLDNERPVRTVSRSDQPRPRRGAPGAGNQKVVSFSRAMTDEQETESRSSESRERPGSYFSGNERPARTVSRTERPPLSTAVPTAVPSGRSERFSRGADTARSFSGNTQTMLEDLKSLDPGILIVFITSNEGRLAEHTMASFVEKVRIGASSAISLAVARKESKDLQLGDAGELQIRSDKGSILLFSLGVKGVLTVVADQHADTERILHESYHVANRLMSIR